MQIVSIQVLGESGTTYTIDVNGNGTARCSCPSFLYQPRWCKHLAFVFDVLGVSEKMMA